MSSLAAARADNFYYPKDWRPEHGSINKFHKSHPLGKRAKDIADGILVVRFEMPFNVWCTHCQTHIGRGVRYNAKKQQVGKYFTTIIYEFRMNCAACQQEMIIQTDPEHRGYALISGVRKKNEAFEPDQVLTEHVNDEKTRVKLAENDPFFRLEHEQDDLRRAKARSTGLTAIMEVQDAQFKDDYASNAALRSTFRKQKRKLKRTQDAADAIGFAFPILEAEKDDVAHAKAMVFQHISGKKKLKRDPTSNSFQHFGDSMAASKLHQMKRTRQITKKPEGSTVQDRAARLAQARR